MLKAIQKQGIFKLEIPEFELSEAGGETECYLR